MLEALKECDEKWLDHEFRGHNIRAAAELAAKISAKAPSSE